MNTVVSTCYVIAFKGMGGYTCESTIYLSQPPEALIKQLPLAEVVTFENVFAAKNFIQRWSMFGAPIEVAV